jgi:hypothetical protein
MLDFSSIYDKLNRIEELDILNMLNGATYIFTGTKPIVVAYGISGTYQEYMVTYIIPQSDHLEIYGFSDDWPVEEQIYVAPGFLSNIKELIYEC